ncbi:cobalamin-5'-phosphate synthase [Arboricoccus pini]|uniref:Adenosylcobinamide-GDP ribazoletransferase n=1 Tax=Arboricoccus pini TaxID=1963835 RepID=A0A212QS59_9PROT|nr:adenosylcobinamide-GDP ribazoletransferase [Arboricoccus pini]SNB62259.1 cobalamin-5'-phosphate synthase [Arboricoccus pini]
MTLPPSLRPPLLAISLLTRLPLHPEGGIRPGELRGAAGWFPLAGLVVGLAGGLTGALALRLGLPPHLAALACLATSILLTGALHEDGLADTADALGAGTKAERALAIMKDSRIGTYGAIALYLFLTARLLALATIAELGGPTLIAAGVTTGAASRALLPLVMRQQKPARPGGLGASIGRPTRGGVRLALTLGVLPALVLLPTAIALAGILAVGVASLALARDQSRRLGGFTGDTLGALQQTAEVAFLLVLTTIQSF